MKMSNRSRIFFKKIVAILCFPFCLSMAKAQDTLAHWGFNESSGNKTIESVSNTNFTVYSNWPIVEWVPGVKQNAMRTDGYSVWAQGILPNTLPKNGITITAWVAPEVYPVANSAIFAQFDDNAKTGAWIGMNKYGRLIVEFNIDGAYRSFNSNISLTHYKWNYVVVNINAASGTVTGYVNANKIIDATYTSGSIVWPTSKNTLIGKYPGTAMNGLYNTSTMNAIIDEVILFKTPLDQTTITQNFQQDNPSQDPSMKTPASRFATDLLRPKYHPIPNSNWCNESHGLIYYNGMYHLFYQKNGNGCYLFQQNWGHLESPDLVTWKEVAPALWPSPGWDNYGIWSGHCVLDFSNTPKIFYTGVDGTKAGIGSASPDSTNLIEWGKNIANPFIPAAPNAVANNDFRDPHLFQEGNTWYMIVGTGLKSPGVGAVFLYQSTDLNNWQYVGVMYQGNTAQYPSGVFWEMPVFYKFGGKYMLLVNKTPEANNPARAFYWVGNFNGKTFTPDNTIATNLELINRLLSPSVNTDKNGIVTAIGIIPDLIPSSEQYKHGYANVFSLPREWYMQNDQLFQKPHHALQKLRKDSILFKNINITTSGSNFLNGAAGFQKEIRAVITPSSTTKTAGLIIEKNPDGSESTSLYYNYATSQIVMDKTKSSLNPNTQGILESVTFPLANPLDSIDWHVFIDGSVVEVFINDKYAFASRIYPASSNSKYIDLFTTGGSAIANVKLYNVGVNNNDALSWISFSAQKMNNTIQLQWQTANEINNDHFEVEKSSDGLNFSEITSIASNNDSSVINTYNYTDASPIAGINFYRIKQMNKDGSFSYSIISEVNLVEQTPATTKIKILQNPVTNGSLQIQFPGDTQKAGVSLYDSGGCNFLSFTQNNISPNQIVSVPINRLAFGVYFLRITSSNKMETFEIVINN